MQATIMDQMEKMVSEKLGDGYDVKGHQVVKSDALYLGVEIRKDGCNYSPVINVDRLVKAIVGGCLTVEEAAEKIVYCYRAEEQRGREFNPEKLIDRQAILDRVVYKVVGENRIVNLEGVPHKKVMDLVVTYKVILEKHRTAEASYQVTDMAMEAAGISAEELDEAAARNTKSLGFQVGELEGFLKMLTGQGFDTPEDAPKMYMVTTESMSNGSVAILYSDLFKELAEKEGDDLYILPSSVHELLIVSASHNDYLQLKGLVQTVNREVLDPNEVLSDSVYKYNRSTGTIQVAA